MTLYINGLLLYDYREHKTNMIPTFKSPEDWETFYLLFDKNLHQKKVLLERTKDVLISDEVEWNKLDTHQLEFLLRFFGEILFQSKEQFHQMYPDYLEKDDQIDNEESLENI